MNGLVDISIVRKIWRDITRIRCYPSEKSNMFFCEVHHHTKEGSTLDGFSTHEVYFTKNSRGWIGINDLGERDIKQFGILEPTVAVNWGNKKGYCKLTERILDNGEERIKVICGHEPTLAEWLKK